MPKHLWGGLALALMSGRQPATAAAQSNLPTAQAAGSPLGQPALPRPQLPTPRPPGSVLVHLVPRGNFATGLYLDPAWQHVCYAPCDKWVDPRQEYRIDGPGIMPSPAFTLPGSAGAAPVLLNIDPFSLEKHRRRLYVTLTGGALVLAGIAALAVAVQSPPLMCDHSFLGSSCTGIPDGARYVLYGLGGVALGVGAGLTITGGYYLAKAKTTVKIELGRPLPSPEEDF